MKKIILIILSLALIVNCGGGKDTKTETDKSHAGHTHSSDPADKMTEDEILGDVSSDSEVVGTVKIGKNTIIKNSRIRGPVIIGEGCKIEKSVLTHPSTTVRQFTKARSSSASSCVIATFPT